MKKTKKLLSLLLVITLVLSIHSPVTANSNLSNSTSAKIDPTLKNILLNSNPSDLVPVDIWFYESEMVEKTEAQLLKTIGFNKQSILNDTRNTFSSTQIDKYISTERELYAKNQREFYSSFQKDYPSINRLQSTKENDNLFLSQYTPLINAKLTPSEIKTLATDSRIQQIYYRPDVSLQVESNISVPLIRANYTRDTLGCTGTGIRIGLLEAVGLPDRNADYFTTTNIIYDPNVTQVVDDHATTVAAVLIGQSTTINNVTYRGIVPNATLYATHYVNNTDWRARIEWLLSQNVNVINMSARIYENKETSEFNGNYNSDERWLDHVALNHSVHFVKSAGNNGGNITRPGMAYNIITVGAINDNNTVTHGDDLISGFSSFNEDNALTNKPDLVAPGEEITSVVATTETGTSIAAPHVTAVVAQLCQRKPALKLAQDVMKAILSASISHNYFSYDTSYYEYDQFGAGVIDARSAFYTADNGRYISGSFAANSGNGTEKNYTFTVSSSDTKIRISLSWLKYVVLSGTHATTTSINNHALADLDLLVYGPDGGFVNSSTTSTSNTELLTIDNPTPGTYTITVYQSSQSPRAVYFGLAWW